jgi:hypothetical protein
MLSEVLDVPYARPKNKPSHWPDYKPWSTAYVRSHCAVVYISLPANFYLKTLVFDTDVRMISIKGSYEGNCRDMAEAIEFFQTGSDQGALQDRRPQRTKPGVQLD